METREELKARVPSVYFAMGKGDAKAGGFLAPKVSMLRVFGQQRAGALGSGLPDDHDLPCRLHRILQEDRR